MLFDFNFKFKGLDGNEIITDDTAGKVMAGFLCLKTNHLPVIKAFDMAIKLFNGNPIELDIHEIELFKKEILESNLTNLAKAQIINFVVEEVRR